MMQVAMQCPKCRKFYDRCLEQCVECDIKLTKLYNEWQIKNILDDERQAVDFILDDFASKVTNPKIKKLVPYIKKVLQQRKVLKEHHETISDANVEQTNRELLSNRCQFCHCEENLKKVAVYGNDIEPLFVDFVCIKCIVVLRGRLKFEYC